MAICMQNLPFVAFTKPEILRFEVYYRKSLWPGKLHGKLAGKVMLRAYRDLWYRIGTFNIGL